jgi:hypothetical protein
VAAVCTLGCGLLCLSNHLELLTVVVCICVSALGMGLSVMKLVK